MIWWDNCAFAFALVLVRYKRFFGREKNQVFGFTFRVELTKYAIGACDNNWEGTDGSCLKGRSFPDSFDRYNREPIHACMPTKLRARKGHCKSRTGQRSSMDLTDNVINV